MTHNLPKGLYCTAQSIPTLLLQRVCPKGSTVPTRALARACADGGRRDDTQR